MRFLDRAPTTFGARWRQSRLPFKGSAPEMGGALLDPRAHSVPHPLAALAHGKRLVIAPVARLHPVHAVEIQGRRQPIGLQQE